MVSIYKITNEVTGNCYIGSSSRVIRRWAWHLTKLQLGHHNKVFQEEWDSSVIQNWTFKILSIVPKSKRFEEEQKAFHDHKPLLNGDRNRFVCIVEKKMPTGDILKDIENGVAYREIAQKHKVSLGTITNIKKRFSKTPLFT
jgi:hypothetical protein